MKVTTPHTSGSAVGAFKRAIGYMRTGRHGTRGLSSDELTAWRWWLGSDDRSAAAMVRRARRGNWPSGYGLPGDRASVRRDLLEAIGARRALEARCR